MAFELALMGTGKFFEGILIVENTSTGAHRSSDPSTIVLQHSLNCDKMGFYVFHHLPRAPKMQMYGHFEGFALQNAVFGLVIQ